MEKIFKNKTIYQDSDIKNPIPVDKFKDLLQDGDIIEAGFDEGHYSENNSWDPHYYVRIIRPTLETDEEFEKRKERIERDLKWSKERRYQHYLKLKEEFETKKD